jgi:hypothetical protein
MGGVVDHDRGAEQACSDEEEEEEPEEDVAIAAAARPRGRARAEPGGPMIGAGCSAA